MADGSQIFNPHSFRCSQCGVLNSIRLKSLRGTAAMCASAAYYDFMFECGACGAENEQDKENLIPAARIETVIGTPVIKAE